MEKYISFMDYFATGEGRTIEINFCYAANPVEAIIKHLDYFYGDDQSARGYFGIGVEAVELESKRAKEIISVIFTNPEGMIDILKRGGQELRWKFRFNFS